MFRWQVQAVDWLLLRAVNRKRGELSLHGVSLYSFLALVPTSC